jgi:hypothetical protein
MPFATADCKTGMDPERQLAGSFRAWSPMRPHLGRARTLARLQRIEQIGAVDPDARCALINGTRTSADGLGRGLTCLARVRPQCWERSAGSVTPLAIPFCGTTGSVS